MVRILVGRSRAKIVTRDQTSLIFRRSVPKRVRLGLAYPNSAQNSVLFLVVMVRKSVRSQKMAQKVMNEKINFTLSFLQHANYKVTVEE